MGSTSPLLIAAGETFQNFQKFCRRSPTISASDADNMETVFCIAEALREAGVGAWLPSDLSDLDKLRSSIQLWLWKVYHICQPADRTELCIPYRDMFDLLKDTSSVRRVSVISTNYDLVFEYMAWTNGQRCAYALQNAKAIKIGTGNEQYAYVGHDNSPDCIPIHKLHGSVNFFEHTGSKEDTVTIATDVAEAGAFVGRSRLPTPRPAILALDAVWKLRQSYGEKVTPAIVPPTYAKLEGGGQHQSSWQKETWRQAHSALAGASRIIFIGYSMPASDGFMRALIHGSLAHKGSCPEVFVIDPSTDVHATYQKLFGSGYRDIGQHTLERALKSGAFRTALGC